MSDAQRPVQTICVVGLGYIGLPTAVFFARAGYEVIGVDINPQYVAAINKGVVPFFEPDFEELLQETVHNGSLRAQGDVPPADVYIIAVPTPFAEGHQVDDSYILAAASNIAKVLRGGDLVVLESTSPPKTTEKMLNHLLELRPDLTAEPGHPNSLYAAHCPERVLPGYIVQEMVSNDRVIGGTTPEAARRAAEVYASFCKAELLLTDATTAEMAKLAENSFRDVNIAYANELSLICDELGISVWDLINLANHHPRVNILSPGPGVGGHCIAVDPWFIVSSAPNTARLIRTAREVNDAKPVRVLRWVSQAVELSGAQLPTVAVLGLAFKPDVDDLRESPAMGIARSIVKWSASKTDAHVNTAHPRIGSVLAVEPNIRELPSELAAAGSTEPGTETGTETVSLVSMEEAIAQADIVVLLVEHQTFRELPRTALQGKILVDTKGLWADKPVSVP